MFQSFFKFQILFWALCICANQVVGQQSFNAAGGNAKGKRGSVSFSVGILNYTSHTNKTGSVTQGVQHTYEITEEKERDDYFGKMVPAASISMNVYPNPTPDELTIKINENNSSIFHFQLVDQRGRVLQSGKIYNNQTQISMVGLSNGMYFINIVDKENNKIKSFRVIKN